MTIFVIIISNILIALFGETLNSRDTQCHQELISNLYIISEVLICTYIRGDMKKLKSTKDVQPSKLGNWNLVRLTIFNVVFLGSNSTYFVGHCLGADCNVKVFRPLEKVTWKRNYQTVYLD